LLSGGAKPPLHFVLVPVPVAESASASAPVLQPDSGIGHFRARGRHHPHALAHPLAAVRQAVAAPRAGIVTAGAPYAPAQARHAYGFDQVNLNGAGQTIAVIDAYDDPNIGNDLAAFDRRFGLPNTALIKAVPTSGAPVFDAGWAGEIALDVEWAHAAAPGATILLVESPTATLSDLFAGVDFAVGYGAKQVTMSWGGPTFGGQAGYDVHFNHPGVSFFDASGDNGAGTEYPSSSPFVTAVGGTTLMIDGNSDRLTESAWGGSGGGMSHVALKPGYQLGFMGGRHRTAPDVALDADPSTGYFVYDTSSGGGWYMVGGTSAASPQWAGLTALANQGRAAAGKPSVGTGLRFGTNQALYALAGGSSYTNPRGDFVDITAGGNGYPAGPGYDLATGLGSPAVGRLVPDLINS
jgi:subtilase family serine protease